MDTSSMNQSIVHKTVGGRQLLGHTEKTCSSGHDVQKLSLQVWWFDSFDKYSSTYPKHDPLLLRISSGRGKHACKNKKRSISLAAGRSVIGMTTYCCITEIRSLKPQTKAFFLLV